MIEAAAARTIGDAWIDADPTLCDVCGRDACEDHLPAPLDPPDLPAAEVLEDAVDVAMQGRQIARDGVPFAWADYIPALGMLGFLVAYAKVGKTTFGHALAAAIAMGRVFLGRATQRTRVLVIAAEDPPEYTAWLARHLDVERGWLTFLRRPLILDQRELSHICALIARERFGLVLIASWQSVVRGLIRDENDNAGAVRVVEDVKTAARTSGIPWLIDAHSGKGEDQQDEADPTKAMRGASAAAGAADYMLSLRYSNGTFGTERRLSGKGRFVSCPPIVMDFDPASSTYTVTATNSKDATRATTWRLIEEIGALTATPQSATEIAEQIGLVPEGQRAGGQARHRVVEALRDRPDVGVVQEVRRGRKTTLYRRLETGE